MKAQLLTLLCACVVLLSWTVARVEGRCSGRQFECADRSKCIPTSWRCDEENDCDDGSDESDCAPRTCSETEFACVDGNRCILQRWHCDGDADCDDGSDEDTAVCTAKTCSAGQFSCGQGSMCIPESWRCDEQKDCPNGADESQCANVTCAADEFTCNNSKCITAKWHCDQDNDCGDSSDEDDCPSATCSPNEFRCNNTKCIPARWRCDGDIDCSDNSDETECPESSKTSRCSDTEFTCKSGDCIHQSWKCDSDPDCHDQSDEENCGVQTCGPEFFTCHATTDEGPISCIPGYQQCDGHADCDNEADEMDCPTEATVCDPHTEFDCQKDGRFCIPLDQVCNQHNDCGGGEDEFTSICNTLVNECDHKNGNCSHECKDTKVGYYCECHNGYKLDSDNRTCSDIDECKLEATCSHTCVNTEGSYKCSCNEGYYADPELNRHCKAGGEEPSLLFANRHDLREFKIHTQEYFILVGDQRSAVAMDYDFGRKRLYWSDVAQERILATNLTNNHHKLNPESEVIVSEGISTPDGIALDWVHNLLYWTDTGNDCIEVVNLDSKLRKKIIQEDLEEPRALVLDPRDKQGFIYWTDWGEEAKIEKAGLDGSHRRAIISHGIKWPNGLAIDYASNQLYWIDAKLHLISRSDLEGGSRKIMLTTNKFLHHPFALAVFEDSIYWTDWETQSLHMVDKFDSQVDKVKTLVMDLITPMDIHVYHSLKQPNATSRCTNNGGCSHLCLPSPYINPASSVHSCHCPVGVELDKDMKTCLTRETTTIQSTSPAIIKIKEPTDDQGKVITSGTVAPDNKGSGTNYIDDKKPNRQDEEQQVGRVAAIVIGVVVLLAIIGAVIGFFVYRSYRRKNIRSMNFDNPVYRKTTEDQFSLEKNQYQPSQTLPSTLEPLTSPSNEMV